MLHFLASEANCHTLFRNNFMFCSRYFLHKFLASIVECNNTVHLNFTILRHFSILISIVLYVNVKFHLFTLDSTQLRLLTFNYGIVLGKVLYSYPGAISCVIDLYSELLELHMNKVSILFCFVNKSVFNSFDVIFLHGTSFQMGAEQQCFDCLTPGRRIN